MTSDPAVKKDFANVNTNSVGSTKITSTTPIPIQTNDVKKKPTHRPRRLDPDPTCRSLRPSSTTPKPVRKSVVSLRPKIRLDPDPTCKSVGAAISAKSASIKSPQKQRIRSETKTEVVKTGTPLNSETQPIQRGHCAKITTPVSTTAQYEAGSSPNDTHQTPEAQPVSHSQPRKANRTKKEQTEKSKSPSRVTDAIKGRATPETKKGQTKKSRRPNRARDATSKTDRIASPRKRKTLPRKNNTKHTTSKPTSSDQCVCPTTSETIVE